MAIKSFNFDKVGLHVILELNLEVRTVTLGERTHQNAARLYNFAEKFNRFLLKAPLMVKPERPCWLEIEAA